MSQYVSVRKHPAISTVQSDSELLALVSSRISSYCFPAIPIADPVKRQFISCCSLHYLHLMATIRCSRNVMLP
eukprot:s1888_g2.t1